MQQSNIDIYDDLDEEINLNLKNIFLAFKKRQTTLIKIFVIVLGIFIALTWILPKKWEIDADLYINKANNSNLADVNPFVLDEMASGSAVSMLSSISPLANELEIIQSPIVLENVIKENNLTYLKLFGFIPRKKAGKYITTDDLLNKLIIDNKKGTNVITIEYTSKDKELAYNVVVSVIKNYIELHKIIHSDKAKADKKIIEKEYNKAKAQLDTQIDDYEGVPSNVLGSSGSLAAMSAFSESARNAMSSLTGEIKDDERSRIALSEETQKVAELAKKLQWAKLVEEMSGTSKVLIIKAPEMPREWEQKSPKLRMQILLGIIFGIIFSLIYLIHIENHSKKLTYSLLGNNVIYNLKEEFMKLKLLILANNSKNGKTLMIAFNDINSDDLEKLQTIKNIRLVKADISDEFISLLNEYNGIIFMERVDETDTEMYKFFKDLLKNMNKKILTEILI